MNNQWVRVGQVAKKNYFSKCPEPVGWFLSRPGCSDDTPSRIRAGARSHGLLPNFQRPSSRASLAPHCRYLGFRPDRCARTTIQYPPNGLMTLFSVLGALYCLPHQIDDDRVLVLSWHNCALGTVDALEVRLPLLYEKDRNLGPCPFCQKGRLSINP